MPPVIVPLDGSARAETALPAAQVIAAGGPLTLVSTRWERDGTEPQEYLQEQAAGLRPLDVETTVIHDRDAAEAILLVARNRPGATICMATHGRSGLGEAVLGSVAEEVVRSAEPPVLLVGPNVAPAPNPGAEVVLAVDTPRTAEAITPAAAELAASLSVTVRVVEVLAPPPVPFSQELDAPGWPDDAKSAEIARAALVALGRPTESAILRDPDPSRAIVRFVTDLPASFVVVGTRARHGLARVVLGSVAMRGSRLPVPRPRRSGMTAEEPGASAARRASTAWPRIVKRPRGLAVRPNLVDYERARADFTWDGARRALDGLPGGLGLNIAHEAVDRHAAGPHADRVAFRFVGRDGEVRELTYGGLRDATNRFANALRALGVNAGERVFVLIGRVPELPIAVLGALKLGAVVCPLFSAFGPEPIRERLQRGDGRVLVTTEMLYRRKVEQLRDVLPQLDHVLLVGPADTATRVPDTLDLAEVLAEASPRFEIPATSPEAMALLHFTSGTTGAPKGAVHVHEAVVAHHATGSFALDLHPDDVYWCTADPGWVTGMSYGIIAPLTHGVTSIVDELEFDARRWYQTLQDQRVTVWYTSPTALRMLMKAGPEAAAEFDLRALRFVASVGEPLNPEAVVWGSEVLGLPIHDNWWQTETGGIMISNYAAVDVKPGSMGRPLPGIEAGILRRDAEGEVIVHDDQAVECGPGEAGELALRPGWPSMFRGYLHDEERYRRCFRAGWYLTGDLAARDADGYFWFVGRGDDMIKSAGHLIGPFEVESALMAHPAVAEAGVIGKPDPVAGEIVKAFVVVRPGHAATDELRLELIGFGRKRLGAAIAPKEIAFTDDLPKTRSGKIMRRLLKARELGLPEGDLSTLEVAR